MFYIIRGWHNRPNSGRSLISTEETKAVPYSDMGSHTMDEYLGNMQGRDLWEIAQI
jgi:hypothetical protein